MKFNKRRSLNHSHRALGLTFLLFLVAVFSFAAALDCQAIWFKPGGTSVDIQRSLAPDEIKCFHFCAGKKQKVRLEVKSASGNVAFTINDFVDN